MNWNEESKHWSKDDDLVQPTKLLMREGKPEIRINAASQLAVE
jgi:hypothetical protein